MTELGVNRLEHRFVEVSLIVLEFQGHVKSGAQPAKILGLKGTIDHQRRIQDGSVSLVQPDGPF